MKKEKKKQRLGLKPEKFYGFFIFLEDKPYSN